MVIMGDGNTVNDQDQPNTSLINIEPSAEIDKDSHDEGHDDVEDDPFHNISDRSEHKHGKK